MKLPGIGSRVLHDEKGNLSGIVARQLVAWALLAFVGIVIWKMAGSVITSKQTLNDAGEATTTAEANAAPEATNSRTALANKTTGTTVVKSATVTTVPQKKKAVPPTTVKAPAPPKPAVTPVQGKTRVRILVEALNIRVAPDITSDVIDSISLDETVQVIKTAGNWLYVRTDNGVEGYINASMTKKVN